MEMKQLDGRSMDIIAENRKKLMKLFPEVFTEEGIILDKLKIVFGEFVEDKNEYYHFTWNGKEKALKLSQAQSTGTLRPCKEESKNWDTTRNLYIEGDNLEVLMLLRKAYHNKIKMIYIDPPYNTGKDFIYQDDYKDHLQSYLSLTKQVDEEGKTYSTNPESSGRYHTNWLNMMYPRLRVARDLLREDGFIFISIDDNEFMNLKKICDEIFGEANYINTVSLNSKVSAGASGGGEDKRLKKNIEYILIYTKNIEALDKLNSIFKETELMSYIEKMKVENKSFKYINVLYRKDKMEYYKTIKDGDGDDIEIYKVNEYEIKTIKQIASLENISEEEVYYKYYDKIMTTTNAQTSIRDRVWKATDSDNTMYAVFYYPKSGKNKGQKTELIFYGRQKVLVIWLKDTTIIKDEIIYKRERIGTYWDGFSWINVSKEGNVKFPNGKKPIDLIKQMIRLSTNFEDSDIILDFFSGSASTAHAVIDVNHEENSNMRFIMVQLPEPIDPKSKDYSGFSNIAELGKERIRRAGEKILQENKDKEGIENLDVGFKVFKLDSSNIKKWEADGKDIEYYIEDMVNNFVEGRTEEDVLYEIMLKYGIDLTAPIDIRNIAGKNVYSIGSGTLFVCLDNDITLDVVEGIVQYKDELKPARTSIIFKDNGFKNSSVKTNALQILKTNDINEVLSI